MKLDDAAKVLGLDGSVIPAEVKKAYRKACMKFHPDRNPAGEQMMKVVNAAYEVLKNFEGSLSGAAQDVGDYPEELNEALNKIINLEGIIIEVCGAWVWVTGDTRPHSKILGRKEGGAGFYYASKKKAWYYRPADWKSASRGNYSLEQIRDNHGAKIVQGKKSLKLSA